MIGKLRKYDDQKAYGFLECTSPHTTTTFVHITAFQAADLEPRIGATYEYDIVQNHFNGKMCAGNIKCLDAPEPEVEGIAWLQQQQDSAQG